MVVCKCRNIREEDYPTEEALQERIMQPDFHCGQCQIRYFCKTTQNTVQHENSIILYPTA